MTCAPPIAPPDPQVPPTLGAASLGKGTSRRARGPPMDRQADRRKSAPRH